MKWKILKKVYICQLQIFTMKKILLIAMSLFVVPIFGQSLKGWTQVDGISVESHKKIRDREYSERQQLFTVDEKGF